jgi:hypothetical protein
VADGGEDDVGGIVVAALEMAVSTSPPRQMIPRLHCRRSSLRQAWLGSHLTIARSSTSSTITRSRSPSARKSSAFLPPIALLMAKAHTAIDGSNVFDQQAHCWPAYHKGGRVILASTLECAVVVFVATTSLPSMQPCDSRLTKSINLVVQPSPSRRASHPVQAVRLCIAVRSKFTIVL